MAGLAIVYSRASNGINAPLVTVETHLSRGMVRFNIVGLPAAAVKESKDRVRSALMNTHFEFPSHRITINLAPADLPKEGGRFDLPIALGILAASKQIPQNCLSQYELIGELALSGELRPVRGILPVILNAQQSGRQLIVPEQNAREAALVKHATVFFAKHLLEVCAHIKGEQQLPTCRSNTILQKNKYKVDLADVKGQLYAKRALEIAAAGRHSMLFFGPPGGGKTMLACRLPTLLPDINDDEALEVAAIASLSSRGFDPDQWKQIPFRSPHHSSSSIALVGGGRPPRPGEISLAHRGVLFLDELPEFNRQVLESLREPFESGTVTISRAAYQSTFPAVFQFIAAMNPCPCGYAGSNIEYCRCTGEQIKRYLDKISAPLLDRIDMHVEVRQLSPNELASKNEVTETSASVYNRVLKASEFQIARQGKFNAYLSVPELEKFSQMSEEAEVLLNQAMLKLNLSARGYHRIIKVARTIADCESSLLILKKHLAQALNYRCLDRIKSTI